MAVMKSTRTLRKTPGGESTGHMAMAGTKVSVLDDATPPWTKIELIDVDGKPQGFVSDKAIDKEADSLGPLDKLVFAKECIFHAVTFGVNAHYLMSIADMRTNVTDGDHDTGTGPFAFSGSEWAHFGGLEAFAMNMRPEDINSWRAQCLVFALNTRLFQKKMEMVLADQPTAAELCLAQMTGTWAATIAIHSPERQMEDIINNISASEAESEALDTETLLSRYDQFLAGKTALEALSLVGESLDKALLNSKPYIEKAGAEVIDTSENPAIGAKSGTAGINYDSSSIPSSRRDIAKLVTASFAAAGYGVIQQIAALANAIGESNLNPKAKSPAPENSYGLFQLNRDGGVGAGHAVATLKDPQRNIEIMLASIEQQKAADQHFRNTTSLHEAVSIFVRKFERPADTSGAIKKRFAIAQSLRV